MVAEQENKENLNRGLKALAKGSFLVLISVFFAKILTYIYRILIARNFGPEIYGLFSLALMISGLLVIFAKFGMTGGVTRFIPLYLGKNNKSKAYYIYRISLTILSLAGISSGILLYFFAEIISTKLFNNPNLAIFLKVFSIIIPTTIVADFFLSVILAFEKIGWHAFIYNVVENAAKAIFLIAMILIGFKTGAILFSHLMSMLIVLFAAYLVSRVLVKELKKNAKPLSKKQKSFELKALLTYSWPVMFFGFAWQIFHWTDTLMIGYLMSAKDAGYYNVAGPIAMLLNIATSLFIPLFFPLITREYSKSKNLSTIKELSKQIGKWIFIINLPILAVMLFFPETTINIMFGSQYLPALNAMKILSIGYFINSMFSVSERLISMLGKSRLVLYDVIVASIFNIILNIVLIPTFGITGAALSTTASFILLNLLFAYQAKKQLSIIPIRKKMLWIALSAIFASALIYLMKSLIPQTKIYILLILLTFVLVYFLLCLLLKTLDKNDIMIIKSIKNRLSSKFSPSHSLAFSQINNSQ